MSDGYQVNQAQLSAAADQVSGKAKEADTIRGKVTAANGSVPPKAWGLLGNLTVYHVYQQFYGRFSDHVNQMISGVRDVATGIKNTADQYQRAEEAVARTFSEIEDELGDGTER